MKLTIEEARSALWLKIKADAEEKLGGYRTNNDYDLSEKETQKLRGRILEVKELLDIGIPDPAPTAEYGEAASAQ